MRYVNTFDEIKKALTQDLLLWSAQQLSLHSQYFSSHKKEFFHWPHVISILWLAVVQAMVLVLVAAAVAAVLPGEEHYCIMYDVL